MTSRRLVAIVATATLAISLAGCAGSENPAWTYAPPPPATPTPAPTEAPSASATTGPSAAPSASGGAEAPAGAIAIAALNIQFDKTELTGPADTAFTISFDNQDAGVPHNVEILDANGGSIWKGDIFNGPEKRDYQVPAIPAGSYKFHCTVHPNMVGTITLQ